MKRLGTLPFILAVGLLISACTDRTTTLTSPALNLSNAPDASGIVMRGEKPDGAIWADLNKGQIVFIGIDPVDICIGGPEPSDFDLVAFQDVHLPEGRPVLALLKGEDLRTSVWPIDVNCYRIMILGESPLAEGISDLVNTDNDLQGRQPGDKNANAFGWRAHGNLIRSDGTNVAFSGHQQLVWNDALGTKTTSSKISLH